MEWSIKSLSKRCCAGNEAFADGDIVVCFVVKKTDGALERFDVLERNLAEFVPEGVVVGFWKRVFSSNTDAVVELKQKLASQEDFFVSLFDVPETDDGDTLKQLLALFFERKRILKSAGAHDGKFQRFVHVKTKREFLVPVKEITPESLSRLGAVIDDFIM